MTTQATLAREIVRQLHSAGFQAFFAGGCVRDFLLHLDPKDFDVATDARPEELLRLFPGALQVGAHFGVVIVRDGSAQVDVATFRSDRDYTDGRRPSSVHFETDPRQDVLRRDFTINALLLNPETDEVIDFAGGRQDLDRGIIRAIGDAEVRFREDHLRMLRAVRFAARFGFTIHDQTKAAILKLRSSIRSVSAERVRDEIVRILIEGGARYGFELLDETGLLTEILPEIAAMKGVEQPPEFHPEGDVWKHTLLMLERMKSPTPSLAMGVLLHDVGKPVTFRVAERIRFDGHVEAGVQIARGILTRLRFSNEDAQQVIALVENHMKFKDVARMRESTLKRFLRLHNFEEHLELHRLDALSSNGILENYQFAASKRSEFGTEQIAPPRLVSGHDLMAAGFQPGPEFSRILHAIEDAQLEGRIQSKEEGLELARNLLPLRS